MSGRDAWMPLYVADYLADTAMLTMEQSGAYLHLLMQYYRTGPLPDDDIKLATICRTTRTHFVRHIGPAVRPFFTAADGRLHQKRADLERQKRQDISAARAAAGAKSRGKLAENMPNFAAETGENLFPDLNENNSLTLANAGTKPAVLLVDAVPAETVRGTRLRQDWQPSADEVAYALNEGLDAERIAADFRDHWCSKTGKDATKLNWSMTWQNGAGLPLTGDRSVRRIHNPACCCLLLERQRATAGGSRRGWRSAQTCGWAPSATMSASVCCMVITRRLCWKTWHSLPACHRSNRLIGPRWPSG